MRRQWRQSPRLPPRNVDEIACRHYTGERRGGAGGPKDEIVKERIVYSTGLGSLCPNCRRPVRECVCPQGAPGKPKPIAIRVGRETQGRAGKGVTTVSGLPLSAADIEVLATKLKKRCGSGGTVRGGVVEIQGDHRDVIVAELIKLGWQAKR